MKIRELKVRNFRGIKSLDWTTESDFICLVGPGDSGKTTILDALSLVLSPRWNVSLSDVDFYAADPSEPLTIEVTVSELSPVILDSFATDLRGWDGSKVVDEPFAEDEDLEPALSIRLSCDDSLEPVWEVITDRNPEGRHCSSRDRERLGLVRLGDDSIRHLSWARGSALTRLVSGDDDVGQVLAQADRSARSAVDQSSLDHIGEHLDSISQRAALYGAGHRDDLRIALDTSAYGMRASGLSLHSGSIPVARAGLGSRRLSVTAIQSLSVPHGAAILIDEVEHGLEPHRVRHLVRSLADLLAAPTAPSQSDVPPVPGQVILSTHSPVVVQEVDASNIFLSKRTDAGVAELVGVPEEMQGLLRKHPGAVLSSAVVVCEGKTELGIVRGLEEFITTAYLEGHPPAHRGVEVIDGGGSAAAKYASQLRRLGFEVFLFADGDRPINPTVEELTAMGVALWLWPDEMCTEQRLAADLPWEGVVDFVRLAHDYRSPRDVAVAVSRCVADNFELGDDPTVWREAAPEDELRVAIADSAKESVKADGSKSGGWFKLVEPGEGLGKIIEAHWDAVDEPTKAFVQALSGWIRGCNA